MSTIGFVLFIIGAFKGDKRFYKAGGFCVLFDVFAILLSVGIIKLIPFIS